MSKFHVNDKAKIRESYSPKDEELEQLQHVYKRKHEMAEGRNKYDKDWDKWEKQYESYRPEKSADDWKSNIVPPVSTAVVETIMSEINQYDLEAPIKPRGEEDIPRVEILKEAFKFTKNIGDFKLEEEDIKKEAIIYGTGFGEELFWEDARDVTFMVEKLDMSGKTIVEEQPRRVFTFKDTYLEHVPVRDLYLDEAGKTINRGRRQCNDGARRIVMTKDAAIDYLSNPRFNRNKNLKYLETGHNSDFYQFYEPPHRIDNEDEVEILFYVAKRPDWLIVVANDVLMHGGPNVYNHKMLPWAEAFDIKRTNSLYHKGEMELLDSIQEELSLNRRMRLDRSHLTIDPMWLSNRRNDVSEYDTMSAPHRVIEADDIDQLREIRPSDTAPSAYKEEEALLKDAVRVTGIDDGSQSLTRSSLTATEFSGLREATLKKVALKLWHIHNGFHVSHAKLRIANILQFWTQEKYEKVVGDANSEEYLKRIQTLQDKGIYKEFENQAYERVYPKIRLEGKQLIRNKGSVSALETKGTFFFEVRPEDILPAYGGYDIVYDGAPEVPLTKTIMQAKAGELVDRIMPIALSGIGSYDPAKITDWLVKKHDVDPDTWKTVEQEGAMGADPLAMAQAENEQMMQGQALPPTPNAIEQHTLIHTAYMKSKIFQDVIQAANNQDQQAAMIVDAFADHTLGESMAQKQRKTATAPAGAKPSTPPIAGTDGQSMQSDTPLMPPGGKSGSSPMASIMKRFGFGGGK